jgi:hypothetical protein
MVDLLHFDFYSLRDTLWMTVLDSKVYSLFVELPYLSVNHQVYPVIDHVALTDLRQVRVLLSHFFAPAYHLLDAISVELVLRVWVNEVTGQPVEVVIVLQGV